MSEGKNIANTARIEYDVFIGGTDVGYCDKPECSVETNISDIKLEQLFEQVVGGRIVGIKGSVKFSLREITVANFKRAFPWDASGRISATLGADVYQYAVIVTFHPRHVVSTDKTLDITFTKAVFNGKLNLGNDVPNDAVIPLEMICYPDREKLPVAELGYIGAGA